MRKFKKGDILKCIVFLSSLVGALYLVLSFPPENYTIPLFFLLLFLVFFTFFSFVMPFTFSPTTAVIGYFLLRYFHMDNLVNLLLLTALVLALFVYEWHK
jgi:hypothetical protein